MNRIRSGAGKSRQQPRIGAPDPALTPNTGLAVITELCERLGVIEALDTAVGPIKQRERGFGAGELLCGIAAVQLAGEDFLTGLDRQRADAAGQQLTPVPGVHDRGGPGPAGHPGTAQAGPFGAADLASVLYGAFGGPDLRAERGVRRRVGDARGAAGRRDNLRRAFHPASIPYQQRLPGTCASRKPTALCSRAAGWIGSAAQSQAGGRPETMRLCGQFTGSVVTTELKVSAA